FVRGVTSGRTDGFPPPPLHLTHAKQLSNRPARRLEVERRRARHRKGWLWTSGASSAHSTAPPCRAAPDPIRVTSQTPSLGRPGSCARVNARKKSPCSASAPRRRLDRESTVKACTGSG